MVNITKLNNFNRHNRFVLIINFHNCFVKALTEIFQFCRALVPLVRECDQGLCPPVMDLLFN